MARDCPPRWDSGGRHIRGDEYSSAPYVTAIALSESSGPRAARARGVAISVRNMAAQTTAFVKIVN